MMMTAAPRTLRDYLDEFGELPPDSLLGRIVLFTVNDGKYSFDAIDQWFSELKLNRDMMPVKNKAVDAFRKATSDMNNATYPLANGREATMLCRDVTTNDAYVRRQITREVRDSKNRKLDYGRAITCTFYRAAASGRGGERLDVRVQRDGGDLDPTEFPAVDEFAKEIEGNFLAYYQYLDGNKVRATVRKYLKHLNAIEIKGGVYFVHVSRDDELRRLATFVDRLNHGSYMQTIPIVDLKKEREFIAQAFEREASQSLQEITREAKNLLETRRSITPAMYQKMRERFDVVLANAQEHMVTLDVSHDITAASAEVALKALGALREEMLK